MTEQTTPQEEKNVYFMRLIPDFEIIAMPGEMSLNEVLKKNNFDGRFIGPFAFKAGAARFRQNYISALQFVRDEFGELGGASPADEDL